MGVPAFALGAPSGDDIGMLWHAQLARRFEASLEAWLEASMQAHAAAHRAFRAPHAFCALRASDRFVLERLAAPRGGIVLDVLQT
ncbi:MAG: hypothetical protein LBV73_04805 [Paraburkholderia sp.]|nr:hypothetical protein [Paraburkholderia sp.]